ncbi:hypothetical protein [Nesterenkonia sphaerica]|uniref:PH domain-containing protein n=1 Tax=Nesterenkonia sphaerica TaxID=1804988 RepID=A0A5R9ALC5_9MICC|nr:hypothetical protein [Nesterenkonia sphaerica]TLP79403.1 hypothetical protein FEF27_02040 [Nesterenkonia sphaerica]
MSSWTASVTPVLTRAPEMTGTYLNFLWAALGVVAVFCALIWLGWRNRKRRQTEFPGPLDVPADLLEATPQAAAEGMVIGTVRGGQYLDRIAVHELGLRTTGRVEVHPTGAAIFRSGVRNIFIPAADLVHARTDRGMIGKFVEKDGVVILGWRLGATHVDTGFRPRRSDEGRALVRALNDLTEGETTI